MNCASASANCEFTAKRISLNEGTSVTASTSTEIQCRRSEGAYNRTRESRCPKPSRHSDVYSTTFGTRRRIPDDKYTVVNIHEDGKCPLDRLGRRNYCEQRRYNVDQQCLRGRSTPPKAGERADKQQFCQDAACMATDEERRKRDTEPPLPYWHIATAAARIKQQEVENQYDKERAAQAWDAYLAGAGTRRCEGKQPVQQRNFGNVGCYRRSAGGGYGENIYGGYQRPYQRGGGSMGRLYEGERSRGMYHHCGGNVEDAPCASCEDEVPCMNIYERSRRYHRHDRHVDQSYRRRHQSAPPEVGRPFYGATELEKSSLNAINHLLKAEKELRRVHFTAGSILPQARQYIEQVEGIHQDLKLFNTQFRELQKQTNEVLEQKGARHFHFVIQGSPNKYKANAPLPSH